MEKPWLKHYDEGVPATIDYPPIPLDQLLTDAATRYPDHTATIFGAAVGSRVMDAKRTYRQLNDAVNRFAAGLQRLAVCRSNRITGYNYTVYSSALRLRTICGRLFARRVFSPTNC